jgi:hypothetical protein
MNRRGSLLLEAVFALFLLAVVALATLALLAHALQAFEAAEARGRALPLAGAWLETGGRIELPPPGGGSLPGGPGPGPGPSPEPSPAPWPAPVPELPVGPGFLRPGVGGAPVFHHPRTGAWPVGWSPGEGGP